MQKANSIWLVLVMMMATVIVYAQDVTLAGPGNCNGAAVSGTWEVPCGVTSITVDVYGGGGGGGGRGGGSNGGFQDTRGGGGAGGGGYSTITINVTPGSTFSYSAGAGGCGGDGQPDWEDGDNGSTGGNSTFSGTDAGGTPISLAANGGAGGGGGDGSEGSAGSGGAGGTATGGSTNTTGTAGTNGNGGNGGAGGAGAGPAGANGGAGGGDPGGNGAAGTILITFGSNGGPSVTPTIASAPETCSADGTSTVSNYVATETYVFTPPGPTVGAGGAISGMTAGTSYTVVAGTGTCASPPSAPFSNNAATGSVVDPIVSTTAASCTADGASTITTYNAANTYDFTPPGPTVGAGGAVSGMVVGTSYTVTESDLTCTSAPSAPFTNDAQFPTPVITISGTLTYCAGNNTTITASGGVSYVWDDLGNSMTPAITVTQGTYSVGAMDANGCLGTASATVTETPPFPITFSGALSHCVGGSTDITASGGVSYVWNDPPTSATATVTLTQGTYTVVATDASGCTSTDDVTITESATPVADFVVVDACTGLDVQFTDATTLATGMLTDWAWDFGDNTISTDQNPTHAYTAAGTYDVTLVVASGNCVDQITLQATSFPNPVADFTTADVCVGTAADFLDNSSVTGSTVDQWGWDFGGAGTDTQQSPSYTFATAGTYDVTLAVVTADLCTATFTEPITIHPSPVPAFSTVDVCQGTATTFQNQSTVNPGVIAAQAWDFGDAAGVSADASPTYTYATDGTFTVKLVVTTSNGCIDSITQDVTVNPLPVLDVTHTNILCAGETNGTATADALGGTAPYGYVWSDLFQSTSTVIDNLEAGPYTVTVTDALGCADDTTVIVIEPLPINVNLFAIDDTCGLGNGAIQAVVIGGTVPFVYTWSSIHDSTTIYSEDLTPSGWNTMLDAGEYSVVVTDTGGCTISGSTIVGQIAPPIAAFTTRSLPEEFINPNVQLINESVNSVSYEWHLGDENLSYEEDPNFVYEEAGTYLVMLIAYNDPRYGCTDTTFGYVEVDPMFTFYVPNAFTPDDDGVNDTWGPSGDNFEYESYNVQVYDRWGKLVWQTDKYENQWDGLDESSLEPVKQGMYVYQFVLKKFNTFEPKQITGTITLYRHN